tara:strand:+ start:3412 stop:3987 length:576 start_codon:yes stop_codon:yes gene_type:complete
MKYYVSISFITFLCLFVLGCTPDPTINVEFNYEESKEFVSSKNFDLDNWLQLDSIFSASIYQFKSNSPKYKSFHISKVDSLSSNYDDLSKEFYKNYFFNQIDELKSLVKSIDFDNELSFEKFNNFLSETAEEFYSLNDKISPETRRDISENLGSLYAENLQSKAEQITEDFNANMEDLTNQLKSTFKELFN